MMKRTLKRIAKWIAIIAGIVTGLFLILCTAIIWFFTPARLTPFVEKQASEYINGELKVKRVELIFWKSFPKMTVDIDSLTIISHSLETLPDSMRTSLPADSDSLFSLASFHGGINVLPLLAGHISLYDVRLNSPRANIVQVTPHTANYYIFPESESVKSEGKKTNGEKGIGQSEIPHITINHFSITDATPLRFRSLADSTDI